MALMARAKRSPKENMAQDQHFLPPREKWRTGGLTTDREKSITS
jgi:hypothetical protein